MSQSSSSRSFLESLSHASVAGSSLKFSGHPPVVLIQSLHNIFHSSGQRESGYASGRYLLVNNSNDSDFDASTLERCIFFKPARGFNISVFVRVSYIAEYPLLRAGQFHMIKSNNTAKVAY